MDENGAVRANGENGENGSTFPLLHRAARWHQFAFKVLTIGLSAWVLVRFSATLLSAETQVMLGKALFFVGWFEFAIVSFYILIVAICVFCTIVQRVCTVLIVPWLAYGGLLGLAWLFFKAYKISAIGLYGGFTGLSNTTEQSAQLLLRFYPYFPMTPFNLAIAEASGGIERLTHLIPDTSYNYSAFGILIAVSIVSIFARRAHRFRLILVALVGIAGILFTFLIISDFRDIKQPVPTDFKEAAPSLCFIAAIAAIALSVIIFYGTTHIMTGLKQDEIGKMGLAFPPSLLAVGFIALFLMPALADLENVHSLERKTKETVVQR